MNIWPWSTIHRLRDRVEYLRNEVKSWDAAYDARLSAYEAAIAREDNLINTINELDHEMGNLRAQLAEATKNDNHKAVLNAIETEVKEHPKRAGKHVDVLKKLREDKKVYYIEAEYKNADGDVYEGFENSFSIGTRSEKLKPTVKDKYNRDDALVFHVYEQKAER